MILNEDHEDLSWLYSLLCLASKVWIQVTQVESVYSRLSLQIKF